MNRQHSIIHSLIHSFIQAGVQEVAAALAAPREALEEARAGYARLVAHFAENPAAAPPDGEFWGSTLVAFVRALDAAQCAALQAAQVPLMAVPCCARMLGAVL